MKLNTNPKNQSLLSVRRNELIQKATKAELHIKRLLEEIGDDFCFQKGFFNQSTHYIVDFYIKKRKKLCLEIDGGYHLNPSQIIYDRNRDWFLTEVRGFTVKRITNEQAFKMNAADLVAALSTTERFECSLAPFAPEQYQPAQSGHSESG